MGIVTTTTKAPVAPTAVPMKQLHCDTEELKQLGLRVGNCKFAGAYRHLKPVNSNSNQGLLNGQVLNGAQCKMGCDDFRKKPFMNPKMQCLCKSHLRAKFQIFATLNDIISQTNPMNFINKKQCNWYDRTKKNQGPVEPMSVFPRLKCPSGCPSAILNPQNDCPEMVRFGKTCKITCPNKPKPITTKCIWDKKLKMESFTK